MTEEELGRFREKLSESMTFPSVYMYKFIVTTDHRNIARIENLFGSETVIHTKESRKGSETYYSEDRGGTQARRKESSPRNWHGVNASVGAANTRRVAIAHPGALLYRIPDRHRPSSAVRARGFSGVDRSLSRRPMAYL